MTMSHGPPKQQKAVEWHSSRLSWSSRRNCNVLTKELLKVEVSYVFVQPICHGESTCIARELIYEQIRTILPIESHARMQRPTQIGLQSTAYWKAERHAWIERHPRPCAIEPRTRWSSCFRDYSESPDFRQWSMFTPEKNTLHVVTATEGDHKAIGCSKQNESELRVLCSCQEDLLFIVRRKVWNTERCDWIERHPTGRL